MTPAAEPPADCDRCPRLAAFRREQRAVHPEWFNAPVPPLGDPDAWLAIIGLAPGLKGANRTGRAFTGDGSGAMLFAVLAEHGLAHGRYDGGAGGDLRLDGAMIVNAVRCVPPANRPTLAEVRSCAPHLLGPLAGLRRLSVIVALGRIAHEAVVAALGGRRADLRFGHGAVHDMGGIPLIDTYHCSRYNQNIGRITHNMLWSIFQEAIDRHSTAPVTSPKNIGFSVPDRRERA